MMAKIFVRDPFNPYVFWKMLRNRSRKRALFVSWLPISIIKMFCFFFMSKFNRQVMTSLSSQNQQKFLLMNIKETKQVYG